MSEVVIVVNIEVNPENADAFVEAARKNAEDSVPLEPGCLQFAVVRSLDDPAKISFFEVFENAEALQAHSSFPHAAEFMGKAKAWVIGQDGRRGAFVVSAKK